MPFKILNRSSQQSIFARPIHLLKQKMGKALPSSHDNTTLSGTISLTDLQQRLLIPVNKATADQIENTTCRDHGLFMARQERWDELGREIRDYDAANACTKNGVPLADLLLHGARADAVRAAEHALLHGRPARDARVLEGVEAMETVLSEHPNDYAIALLVAFLHIDIAWAWRGSKPPKDLPECNLEAFEAHFLRATEILDEFCAYEASSAALMNARCALQFGSGNLKRVVDEFEGLIDISPTNPRPLRTLGSSLLPRWQGSFEKLDLEARRTAARLSDCWGAGAYTWVWFDALLIDPAGFGTVEIAYFMDGIYDILDRRDDQHHANMAAAHLFRSWQTIRGLADNNDEYETLANALLYGFDHVVHNHLREIHPLLWGHAELGFGNGVKALSTERLANLGQEIAIKAIALPFQKVLQSGQTIRFSPEGITCIPA